MALIADNENAGNGVNLEKRDDMNERFQHVLGHGLEREMEVNQGKKAARRND